jgi:hypothetical protein
MDERMVTPASDPAQSAPSMARQFAIVVALLLAVAAAAAAWFFLRSQAIAQELLARSELTELGALVAMDAQRKHVNSVNLSTLKSPDSLDDAVRLLPALGAIKSLNVEGTAFGDAHAPAIAQLASLEDLVISRTAITDAGLAQLERLSRLKSLHLADTAITDAGMPSLGRLSNLAVLDISGTKVQHNLEPLAALADLNWLVARRLTLDGEAIAPLGNCRSLRRLSLNETTVPESRVDELSRRKPELSIDR